MRFIEVHELSGGLRFVNTDYVVLIKPMDEGATIRLATNDQYGKPERLHVQEGYETLKNLIGQA